jgi:hypothetical protein
VENAPGFLSALFAAAAVVVAGADGLPSGWPAILAAAGLYLGIHGIRQTGVPAVAKTLAGLGAGASGIMLLLDLLSVL